MGTWLRHRLPERVDIAAMLAAGRFVHDDGSAVLEHETYTPHTFVWFHRDLPDEVPVPGQIEVVHRDERLLVVDKPAFLSSIPRGQHIRESVVVRLRDELGLPELSPLHRLDRITSGLLMLATERRWRGPYQSMFQAGTVRKTYRALAPVRPDLQLPVTVRNHLAKQRAVWQAEVRPGATPNAETVVELESVLDGLGVYRLTPRTGRTHQLRVHLLGLGIPIVDDPLYPEVLDVAIGDFSSPLQLLAAELAFTDPIDGSQRSFQSGRQLPLR
ncbi:pseudouridine synthase [Aeromicrobium sp. CF3.5]|uniref:pseudouridine synthase n=1 Tax=Aeromicrobium sp. CF3.5 TaxID=3373078 RepID=UPI003EE52271